MRDLKADMHVHTYYSDGTQSPEEAVKKAKENGVDFVVLTDHDTTAGTEEFVDLCEREGLFTVKGTEVSAYDGDTKVHMLAYGIDTESKVYVDFLQRLIRGARERTEEKLALLDKVGVHITMAEVEAERKSELSPIHAMYIAEAGAKKGYASDRFEFYGKYLDAGCVGFSVRGRPSPEETIDIVHAAGGISSLAHPGRIALSELEKIKLLERLKERGLDAMEAVYSSHTERDTEYYISLAQKYGLMVTGGSDTHSLTGKRSIGTPAFCPSGELLGRLGL
ncbi:MAG: PHP domain-containing protein [Clostridia bacterium]|nr:PHP domain-containing protein [Clostridia bacterium]